MSIISEASKSVVFALMGRLSTSTATPNFARPSSITMEKYVDGSLQVITFPSNEPAIDPEDGSFLLQPERMNSVTQNLNLSDPRWVKGSSVLIRSDVSYAPDGTDKSETVSFGLGSGNTNVIRRTFSLQPGENYVLSQILKLRGGQFASEDCLRISGSVVTPTSKPYAPLNDYVDKYRVAAEIPFKTTGVKLSNDNYSGDTLDVLEVTNSTVTLEAFDLATNTLVGATILFATDVGREYTITANTKVGYNNVITVTPASLITDGVTIGTTATIYGSKDVDVTVECYVTSALTFDWGGLFIELGTFRTSPIFQSDEIFPRSETTLDFRPEHNPLKGMRTFSIMVDLKDWRGDGNIVNFGDVRLSIAEGKLRVVTGNVTLNDPTNLPNPALIFVQVSSENSNLSVYVDGKLINRVSLPNFQPTEKLITFDTDGIRHFQSVVVMNRNFSDGQVANNSLVKGDLAQVLFNRGKDFININSIVNMINLPPVEIPGSEQPVARTQIGVVNTGAIAVIVASATYFDLSGGEIRAVIERKEGAKFLRVGSVIIQGKSDNTMALDTVFGIRPGDYISTEYVDRPGRASIRLPFSAKETQVIRQVTSANKRVKVDSTVSFDVGSRVICQTPQYQDLGEFTVTAKDDINTTLDLRGDITGISEGDLIILPKSELQVDGNLYDVIFLTDVPGVAVEQKAQNGFVIANYNRLPRLISTQIRVPI